MVPSSFHLTLRRDLFQLLKYFSGMLLGLVILHWLPDIYTFFIRGTVDHDRYRFILIVADTMVLVVLILALIFVPRTWFIVWKHERSESERERRGIEECRLRVEIEGRLADKAMEPRDVPKA